MSAADESSWTPPRRSAHWNGPDLETNPREQYLPARVLQARDGSLLVEPVPWNGSADIVGLSRATYRKMVENLVWATGYNLVAIPVAAGVLVPWGIDLPMAVGAVAMSASTIIVAANAQLLRRLRLRPA